MRIWVTSIYVPDQEQALRFYTEVLEFQKKSDVPLGEFRWLTVVSPSDPEGAELLLEPDAHPAVGPYKQAIFADGIAAASFRTDALKAEIERLRGLGVEVTMEPTDLGNGESIAVVNDTCGNLIQLLGPS